MKIISEIVEKIKNHLEEQRKSYKPSGNNASTAGHPCKRNLVYRQLNWQDRALPDYRTQLIFREGQLHEDATINLLKESGIKFEQTQRPFHEPAINLNGRIDGMIKVNGKSIPAELKSMNPFDFEKINSLDDLKESRKHYLRGYVVQIMFYITGLNCEQGLLILKNKVSGELKFIECPLDLDLVESEWKKLEEVNKHIEAKTYPDRIEDRSVCTYCDFKHVCLPDEAAESIQIEEDDALLELLEERDRLINASKAYTDVDKKVKERMKAHEDGTYLLGGKFQLKKKTQNYSIYNVPDEVRSQYKGQAQKQVVNITKLK